MTRTERLGLTLGLFVLQFADLGTTALALQNGAAETNPLVNAIGWWATASFKGVLCMGIIWGAWRTAGPTAYDRALQFAVILYLAVVTLNVRAAL